MAEEEKEEIKSFKDLGLCDELVEACDGLGWKAPTKIQIEAIPHAVEGSLLIIAVFAFLLNCFTELCLIELLLFFKSFFLWIFLL